MSGDSARRSGRAGAGSDISGEGTGASSAVAESPASSTDAHTESASDAAGAEWATDLSGNASQRLADAIASQSRAFDRGTRAVAAADHSAPADATPDVVDNPSQRLVDQSYLQSRAFQDGNPTRSERTADRSTNPESTAIEVTDNLRAHNQGQIADNRPDARSRVSEESPGTTHEPSVIDARPQLAGRTVTASASDLASDRATPASGFREIDVMPGSQEQRAAADQPTSQESRALPTWSGETSVDQKVGGRHLSAASGHQIILNEYEFGEAMGGGERQSAEKAIEAAFSTPTDRFGLFDREEGPKQVDAAREPYGPAEGQMQLEANDPSAGDVFAKIDQVDTNILSDGSELRKHVLHGFVKDNGQFVGWHLHPEQTKDEQHPDGIPEDRFLRGTLLTRPDGSVKLENGGSLGARLEDGTCVPKDLTVGQTFFPPDWTESDIVDAGRYLQECLLAGEGVRKNGGAIQVKYRGIAIYGYVNKDRSLESFFPK